MHDSSSMIEIHNLGKAFGAKLVLQGINTRVGSGEVIGLLGLNGAGKTTLLEAMLGYCLPDAGEVRVFGQPAHQLSASNKSRIGFVPQRDELLEFTRGGLYLETIARFYPAWNGALVERLCRDWQVPLEQRINSLSPGQRQKLSLVSALGHKPDLLVLQTLLFRSRLAAPQTHEDRAEKTGFRMNATGKKNGEFHHFVRRP